MPFTNPTEQFDRPKDEMEPKPLEFSWTTINPQFKKGEGISLSPDPEKIYAYVVFSSPLPDSLSDIERSALERYVDTNGQEYWYCGFGRFSLDRAIAMKTNKHPSLTKHRETNNRQEKETPVEITQEEVATIIRSGKAIVYTGAGISVAAGTPDMKSLMAYLGIDRSKPTDDFTLTVMFSPEVMQAKLLALQSSFFESPTPAHLALANIQRLTGITIVTENLDMLGEAAGQTLIKRGAIDSTFSDEVLSKLDYIITIGLKADDSGLLWRYKQANPDGKIIALNIEPPPYLSKTDYYLEGDAQIVLPKIESILFSSQQ